MERKRADSSPLCARTTQLVNRHDPLMSQAARHVSARLDEAKLLRPVYHPISRKSKKKVGRSGQNRGAVAS